MSYLRFREWFLVVLAGLCAVSALLAQTGGADGPPLIQRIGIPPERVARELDRVQQGALIFMPLSEFDARWERIQKSLQSRVEKPRLLRAHYRAELSDRYFRAGSGQWTIQHDGAEPAILPIDSLNLAIARARWEQGGAGILGEVDGKALGLLVDPRAGRTFLFDWSARGAATSDGITFNFAVPLCPISTFELTLPADHWLSAPKGVAVTGPHDAGTPDRRIWKLQITGQRQLGITVRRINEFKGTSTTLYARVQTLEQPAPERAAVEFDFQVDILHGSVRELFLEGDAGLQPYDVFLKGNEIKTWQWTAVIKEPRGKLPGGPVGILRIEFRQPVQGKLQGLHVRSLMARPSAALWSSPALRVRGALSRGETIRVELHPDLPQGKWDLGSFQPISIATDAAGGQTLTLAETAADPSSSRRPTLLLPAKDLELYTTEHYQWHLAPSFAELKADVLYAPTRGNFFELLVKLPAAATGYQIEALDLQPAEMLRGWQRSGDSLIVELKQALAPAKKVNLKIHLRVAVPGFASGNRVHLYPDLQPLTGGKRDGTLAVFVDPRLNALLLNASLPLAPLDRADTRQPAPDFRFDFRDQKLSAAIRVTPRPGLVEWRGKHAIALAEDKATLQFRWDAEPIVGAPETLDFRFAPGFPATWKIKNEEGALPIHHWERLERREPPPHALVLTGVPGGIFGQMSPAGSLWRFHLSEPLRKKAHFTIEATLPAGLLEEQTRRLSLMMPRADAWSCLGSALAAEAEPKSKAVKAWVIPLAVPLGSDSIEQEISVDSAFEPINRIAADGSLLVRPSAGPAEKTPFHYQLHQGTGTPFAPASTIRLWTQPGKRASSLLEWCDEAGVTTCVRKDGGVFHCVRFRLWHLRDRTFEMRLPPGMEVVALRLNEHSLERFDIQSEENGVRLTLPFDQNSPFVRYEIHMRERPRGHRFPGWMKVTVPELEWPIAPMDLRKRVCLEKGWTPIAPESLTQIGVPGGIAGGSETLHWLGKAWTWGQIWWPHAGHAQRIEKLDQQKQAVLLAEAQLRRTGLTKPMKLATALERFALTYLRDTAPLIIDAIAMNALGLSGETMLAPADLGPEARRPFWETLGLIYVPCSRGALLTSPGRMQKLRIDGSAQTSELDGAIEEAILQGRDGSNGFYAALTWLNLSAAQTMGSRDANSRPNMDYRGDFHDMTEWEVSGTGARGVEIYVVDPLFARISGVLLAILLVILAWRFRRAATPVGCFRVHVVLLSIGFLLFLWSPRAVKEYLLLPALLAAVGSFAVCLVRLTLERTAIGPTAASTITRPAARLALLAALLFGAAYGAIAQPTAERVFPVFIIDGARPAALVPAELIAKLDTLENQLAHGAAGAVLLQSKYSATVKDSLAKFEVDYELVSFKDQAKVIIPLHGVQLEERATLDGTPVFPTLHKKGFVVPIKGKGPHRLRLAFTVRLKDLGDHIELGFTIPKLVQNEMAVDWSSPAQTFQCHNCSGAEKVVEEAGKALKRWEGQIGYETEVSMRWTSSTGAPSAKTIDVKEAHFWDLRPSSNTLWSSFHYVIGKGTLGQCTIALPDGLHVRSVEASAVTPPPQLPTSIVIKNWQIVGKGGQRRVQIDLAQPATGALLLNLEILPLLAARQFLPLPAPLQGKSVAGLLGYRLDAADARFSPQNLAVQGMTPVEFEQLWKKQERPPIPQASYAYRFQRKTQQAGFELVYPGPARQAQCQIIWNVDFHRADVVSKFSVTSFREDLILLEFSVDPALMLADVAGADVQRWHLQDARLQVWLRQPRKQTTLEITGWRAVPNQGNVPGKQALVLSSIYPLQAALSGGTLEVRPAPGLHAEPALLKKIRIRPGEPLRFNIEGAPFEASVTLRPESTPPDATMLTKIQGTQEGIDLRQTIRLTTNRGVLPNLKLHVKDWPFSPLNIEAPGATIVPIKEKTSKDAGWTLLYSPGLPHEVLVTLCGRAPLGNRAVVSLPTVELEGARVRQSWLAWKDVEITQGDSGKKLAGQKKSKDKIALFAKEAWSRDLSAWQGAASERSLKASLLRTPARANVSVVSVSESTHWTGRHWLHQASFWLVAPEATELRLKFPAAVVQFRALTDGQSQAAWNPSAREFVLPLEAGAIPRQVELRWKYAAGVETLETPNVDPMRIEQGGAPAFEQFLVIPPGFSRAGAEIPHEVTLAARLLFDAQTQMLLAAALAQDSSQTAPNAKLIAAREQQFYELVRQADYALSLFKAIDLDATAELERLANLEKRNVVLAKEGRYDEQRKAAEKTRKLVAFSAPRDEFTLTGVPMLVPPETPSVTLESANARLMADLRTRSELVVLMAVFLLVFSFFRLGLSIARLFGPELAITLCVAGSSLYGFGAMAIFIVGMMVLLRASWIAKRLTKRLNAVPTDEFPLKEPPALSAPPP